MLIAVLLVPTGCAEMNPWSSEKEFPEPNKTPDGLEQVSPESTPASPVGMPTSDTPKTGLPRGMTPGQQFNHQMSARPRAVFPEEVNPATFNTSFERLNQGLEHDKSQPGFASVR